MVEYTETGWAHAVRVVGPALALAPRTFLDDTQASLTRDGVIEAVTAHDSGPIFDWLQKLFPLQGISDRAAYVFSEAHGYATWADIDAAMRTSPLCWKLKSHWHFPGCGFLKGRQTCNEPDQFQGCPLPTLPLRKGVLNQAAFGLYFFIRDVCDGDFVGWIDRRLTQTMARTDGVATALDLREALLEPLITIPGVSRKLWSMALADLLLVGRPDDALWQRTGAAMQAVDSLVHAFLARTGCLRRLDAEHVYGPACYGENGCIHVLEGLAQRTDARRFNAEFPTYFPRFVQFAIWHFCATGGRNICNGVRIDDSEGCLDRYCPAGRHCDRLPLRPHQTR